MPKTNIRNTSGKEICVQTKKMAPDEVKEVELDREIKNLISHGFVKKEK